MRTWKHKVSYTGKQQQKEYGMSNKPIFLATHPRSCSTAFERVMMTREDLRCVHEPFGDAFYYGGERIGERFLGKEHQDVRDKSGFSETTYQDVVGKIEGGKEDVCISGGKHPRVGYCAN